MINFTRHTVNFFKLPKKFKNQLSKTIILTVTLFRRFLHDFLKKANYFEGNEKGSLWANGYGTYGI